MFKSIFGKNKINFDSNKEEDYSNAVTSENSKNSNNHNKNPFRLTHEKNFSNNISPNNNIDKSNVINKKSYAPLTSQKKYNIRKFDRWNYIKKFNKMKTEDEQKESFYTCTEMKQNY